MGDANNIIQILAMILGAGAVYGGIRADLRSAHAKADVALCRADRAHERLDECLRECGK